MPVTSWEEETYQFNIHAPLTWKELAGFPCPGERSRPRGTELYFQPALKKHHNPLFFVHSAVSLAFDGGMLFLHLCYGHSSPRHKPCHFSINSHHAFADCRTGHRQSMRHFNEPVKKYIDPVSRGRSLPQENRQSGWC